MRGQVRILLKADQLDANVHYVIAANHQSVADPFVICSQVPMELWPQLGTFRYLAHAQLFANVWLRSILLSFGSFPTRPKNRLPYGLEAARAFLGRGNTVVFFPEGRRTLPGETKPRPGITQLGADSRVQVIPVHIQWTRGRRRGYQLTIGRPMDPHQSAEAVMQAIYNLPLPKQK